MKNGAATAASIEHKYYIFTIIMYYFIITYTIIGRFFSQVGVPGRIFSCCMYIPASTHGPTLSSAQGRVLSELLHVISGVGTAQELWKEPHANLE